MRIDLQVLTSHMDTIEHRVNVLEKDSYEAQNQTNKLLLQLESELRRNNLKLIGFKNHPPEGIEAIEYTGNCLTELLEIQKLDLRMEINAVINFPLKTKKQRGGKFITIIQFAHTRVPDDILKNFWGKSNTKPLEWRGNKISIFPDYAPMVAEKRRLFAPARKLATELKIQHFTIFPATF